MANSTIPNLVAVSVPALTDLFGVRQSGDARDKKLTATQLLSLAGDVSKVGTPVDNQLGVWTGDGTIEGDTNWQVVGTALQGVLGTGPELRNVAGVNIHPRKGDTDTGIASRGDNRLAMVAQGVDGIKLIGASTAILQQHNTIVGLTAFAGGGAGSATQLNASYSVIDTVATTGDSVKFSTTLEVGVVNYVKNDGVNAMDLFPAAGDDLGNGVGVAISVPAGASVAFIGTVTGSTSTQFIFAAGGGGDVTKVGTPVDNQLGVWTGDGTIEGTTALAFDGSTFTMNLGGGDFRLTGKVELQGANRPAVLDESSSNTNPTFAPLGNSPTSGLGGQGSSVSLIAFSKPAIEVTSLNSLILQAYQTSRAITAFATGGQTNAVILGSSFNILTTVATTGDSVKLPILFQGNDPCTVVYIKNDGANAADVFPGLGDDLGAGLNTAVSVAAGESVSFIATVGSSTWTPFIVPPSGGGDVTKVGTPVNNQVGVWTGDGTIEGDADFTWDGAHLLLPLLNDAVTPTLAFGDGDTGFYESSDDVLRISCIGSHRFSFNGLLGGNFISQNGLGPQIRNVASSAVIPTLNPRQGDPNTGIGSGADDQLQLIAGAVTAIEIIESGAAISVINMNGPAVFAGDFRVTDAAGPQIRNEAATATNPTFTPNRTDDDTGLGWQAADALSLIAGGIEIARASEAAVDQFIISPGAVLGTSALPSLAFGNADTGFHESVDNILKASVGGLAKFQWNGDSYRSEAGAGASIQNETSSATNPTLIPSSDDMDSGIGHGAADQVDLVAGALSCMAVRNVAAARQIGFYTTAPIALQTGVAVTAGGIHAALVALGLITA